MKYLFADESGNFDFSAKGSKYYIVTAISMDDMSPGLELLDLRHKLAYRRSDLLTAGFHATEDVQAVRDEVFKLLQAQRFTIDAVVLEKSKAYSHLKNEDALYRMAWYLLFKYIANRVFPKNQAGLVIAGSVGVKKKEKEFQAAVTDVVHRYCPSSLVKVAAWSAASHPCLQIADYCCWAIQRKIEKQDNRSYALIQQKIDSCFSPW